MSFISQNKQENTNVFFNPSLEEYHDASSESTTPSSSNGSRKFVHQNKAHNQYFPLEEVILEIGSPKNPEDFSPISGRQKMFYNRKAFVEFGGATGFAKNMYLQKNPKSQTTTLQKVSRKFGNVLPRNASVFNAGIPNEVPYSTIAKVHSCEDSMESFEYKKKLIESAKENIVLSGNYCGGEAFDEILDLISEKMKANPRLEVTILSASKFITPENQRRISALKNEHPENFVLIPTDDIWINSNELKKSTNHTKCLSIDNGKYFLLGGSGIENKYAYSKGIGDREGKNVQHSSGAFMDAMLPRGFRDQDFVFESVQEREDQLSSGQYLHYEALKLASLWEGYNQMHYEEDGYRTSEMVQRSLQKYENAISTQDLSEIQMPPESPEDLFQVDPRLAPSQYSQTRIYSTGPENNENYFEESVLEKFNQARESITIDHMYFHPTQRIFDALVAAANRGVQINILTNTKGKFAPNSHKAFVPRNRYNYKSILKALPESKRSNVNIFEFGGEFENTPKQTTLHKKVIVVDNEWTIAGSSNLGYKSFQLMADHEINFISLSRKLANETLHVIGQDISMEREARNSKNEPIIDERTQRPRSVSLSRRMETPKEREQISCGEKIAAFLHRSTAVFHG